MNMKVLTIVGTRPELIKMSRVIALFDKYFNHVLCHTGQNFDYELNAVFFDDLKIRKPDYFLNVVAKTTAATIGNIISKADEVLELEKPDTVLLYGDTNSCLAVIAAKRRKIPVFHMEAGNRCFDQRVPEELNRKIVDHLSDINLVLTDHARNYLLSEGVPAQNIIKTGSHMHEVFNHYAHDIESSSVLENLNLSPHQYFLVSAHREENVDSDLNLSSLCKSLQAISQEYNLPIVVSTHPRTRLRLENAGLLADKFDSSISFMKPFGFHDYNKLQKNAYCVLSDSGTVTEESSLLGFPAVTIRNCHERPEGMDSGVLLMSGLDHMSVLSCIDIAVTTAEKRIPVNDYQNPYVSHQILKLVASYTGYINRVTWNKLS